MERKFVSPVFPFLCVLLIMTLFIVYAKGAEDLLKENALLVQENAAWKAAAGPVFASRDPYSQHERTPEGLTQLLNPCHLRDCDARGCFRHDADVSEAPEGCQNGYPDGSIKIALSIIHRHP